MKILVLNYEFPPIGGGGGAVSKTLCDQLAVKGHQIVVHTARLVGMPRQEREAGYTVYRTYAFRRRPDRCRVWEMMLHVAVSSIPALRLARRWRPDLIHAHFAVPTGALAWVVHVLTGIPYVLTLHLGDVPGAMPGRTDRLFRFFKPFTKPIWRGAAHITAVSEYVRELGERAYGLDVTTIPNGIVMPGRKKLGPRGGEQPLRLVFAGRFDPQKNLLFLLEVLEGLADVNWELHLVGDGPEMPAIQKKIQHANLEGKVMLYGWESETRVDECLSHGHVFFMPSHFEGQPVAAIRALGHGLAMLGSDIGGLKAVVVHGENGFLVAGNDTEAYRRHLRRLAGDDTLLLNLRQASLSRARHFDLDTIVARFEDVFRDSAYRRN